MVNISKSSLKLVRTHFNNYINVRCFCRSKTGVRENFSIVVNKQLFQMTTDHFTAAVTIKS